MKKLLIITIVNIIFSFNIFAQSFVEGKHYIRLPQHINNIHKIVEYFSFFCPHCYTLEKKYHLYEKLNNINNLKKEIKICHVNIINNKIGKILTHIWCMAQAIHVEKKIIIPIFELIHQKNSVLNKNNIETIFIQCTKINKKEYNLLWNSYTVYNLIIQNQKYIDKIYLQYVPTTIINGEYILNNTSLYTTSKTIFFSQYINIIKYLIHKK
ncbi:Thiol:disulfide interchange protein DsbA [Buchnera aphidicola (Eriosoma lanigerum)]